MKIYSDKEMTKEVDILNLQTVLAGESKTVEFFIYNELDVRVEDLSFTINNSEVTIVDSPKFLLAKEEKPLTIKWEPKVNVKKGLKTELQIKGFEVYEP